MRNRGNRAENDAGLTELASGHCGGGGAADQCPIETRLFADLQVCALAARVRNLHAKNQIGCRERMMGFRIIPSLGVEFWDRERKVLFAAPHEHFGVERRQRNRQV